jgi:hypothetical protein
VSAPVHLTLTGACPDRVGIIASPEDPQRAPLATGNTACRTFLVTAGADPRPVLDVCSLPGGALELQLNGVPGVGYAIQCSTDLQRWTLLTSLVLSAGSTRWTQPVVLNRQFYRAVRLDPP